jgi:ketosteroid isomerase-like protein
MASVPSNNAEIVKRGYDAWNRGDIAAVLEQLYQAGDMHAYLEKGEALEALGLLT